MIVVDTNLFVYLHVEGQRTVQAEAVLRRDSMWVAPILWRSEFRDTLAGLVRRRALTLEDALRIMVEAERGMAGREYTVASPQVLLLAQQSGCSAYECEFVSLAQDLGTPLVTADRQVLAAFPAVAVAPWAFAALDGSSRSGRSRPGSPAAAPVPVGLARELSGRCSAASPRRSRRSPARGA